MKIKRIFVFLSNYKLITINTLLVIIFIVANIPNRDTLKELIVLGDVHNKSIKAINANVIEMQELAQHVAEIEKDVDEMKAQLFDRDQNSKNQEYFYLLEENREIDLKYVKEIQEVPDVFLEDGPNQLKLHSVIGYELSISGSYSRILDFMAHLYRTDSLLRVSDFSMVKLQSNEKMVNPFLADILVYVMAEKE